MTRKYFTIIAVFLGLVGCRSYKDIPYVVDVLKKGTEAAREVASQTLRDVKNAMKINYFEDPDWIKEQEEKYKA